MKVRTYEITVPGFPPQLYSARSPGRAKSRCWRDYVIVDDTCTFRKFLTISKTRRIPDPPGIGGRIIVAGRPATRVIGRTAGGLYYMRDDSNVILTAHPSEITEVS